MRSLENFLATLLGCTFLVGLLLAAMYLHVPRGCPCAQPNISAAMLPIPQIVVR